MLIFFLTEETKNVNQSTVDHNYTNCKPVPEEYFFEALAGLQSHAVDVDRHDCNEYDCAEVLLGYLLIINDALLLAPRSSVCQMIVCQEEFKESNS